MLVPSGMTLCQPQSIAYCTEGSKKFLEANFSMVSMPSSLTSALSSYDEIEFTSVMLWLFLFWTVLHWQFMKLLVICNLNVTCLRRHFLIFSTSRGSSFSTNSTMVAIRLDWEKIPWTLCFSHRYFWTLATLFKSGCHLSCCKVKKDIRISDYTNVATVLPIPVVNFD